MWFESEELMWRPTRIRTGPITQKKPAPELLRKLAISWPGASHVSLDHDKSRSHDVVFNSIDQQLEHDELSATVTCNLFTELTHCLNKNSIMTYTKLDTHFCYGFRQLTSQLLTPSKPCRGRRSRHTQM